MKKKLHEWNIAFQRFLVKVGFGMRAKLISIFLVAKVVPLILLTVIAWRQISILGDALQQIAVQDASAALNDNAVENIERMTTDTAQAVADFLYARDDDILYLASLEPTHENYRLFSESATGRLLSTGEWVLAEDGQSWVPAQPAETPQRSGKGGVSTNGENNDMDGFRYREPDAFTYQTVSLYDEITFIDLTGQEVVKVLAQDSPKVNYPMDSKKKDVSKKENTYIKAETYYDQLAGLAPGEIYVSDVIGAYVGSNYIGMYTPDIVAAAAADRGYDIEYDPEAQAYAGEENPNGQRFEGIVRWATPVTDGQGQKIGYVTFALNHDHIMEFVDHQTPMSERYTELPSAYEGNYAFIWDYNCRSICHPRHNSIVGYDPETGEEMTPWLESSIYDAWQASGTESWVDFVTETDWPLFDNQSREKKPAPALTQAGLVGLDGRYLNNAPQCTGWMDLTVDGGSGSFYILWSGLYKLTTAAAIPYYTGQYAPSEANGYSYRGFAFVTIGAGLEDFTQPATDMETKLSAAVHGSLNDTLFQLIAMSLGIIILVVAIAILIASTLTRSITRLIAGVGRFRSGERQFRFNAPVKDEFGTLADSFDDMADSIVDSVKNPLTITGMDHIILYMNDPGLDFCQMTLEEIVGTRYGDSSVYPEDSVYDPIKALEEGREAEIYYLEDRDRYLKANANYFLSKDGHKIGYIIETIDVTDMVNEQLKIEEQKGLLDMIFAASPDLIWYMDMRGEYVTVNPRFAAIAGKQPEEFTGRRTGDMLPPDTAAGIIVNDRLALEGQKPLYTEEQVTFDDGHEETLDSVRTPILDSGGCPVGMLGFARNVTVRVDMENRLRSTQQELEKAVVAANRANEHKGEFLARMSHEIRTPMNAIIGITNIVQKRMDDGTAAKEEVRGHIDQIEASSQHLLGLLNDILDISKIEAGKIELSDETMDLAKLCHTVAGIIRPRCEEKNITFETHFDTFDPGAFLSDALRLRQVLINLLGNAVKFTPECGTITFEVKKLDSREGETLVGFSVRDNGIGISQEAQVDIFQAFEQGGSGVARQYGGTGLGLAISQRIVELFGGQIALESALGKGSCFSFALWLRQAETDLPPEVAISETAGAFKGKKALLVDDVDINRMIVISMLEDTGLAIDEAVDGVDAVEKFKQSAVGEYDIILMDVQMPSMDGYEASTIIRGLPRPDAQSVPILALTANAFKEDIDKALSFGMNGHIAKPVEMDTLLEVMFRFLPHHS